MIRNAISVDVEDYFQTEAMSSVALRESWERFSPRVEANTNLLLEMFAGAKTRATFFFLGWVAERYPGLVQQTLKLGHEIGCHSYWHHPVFRLSERQFFQDTYRAKSVIEDAAGVPVRGYRAPNFSINSSVPWAYPVLEQLGFHYDSSVYPVRHELYGNHNAPRHPYRVGAQLMELPLATWSIAKQNLPVAGGAYLRILPYALMKNGIRSINNNENAPAVLYLHPWEIDDSQPRLKTSWKSRRRQYTGLAGMKFRLERLLKQFLLGTIYDSVYLPAVAKLRVPGCVASSASGS